MPTPCLCLMQGESQLLGKGGISGCFLLTWLFYSCFVSPVLVSDSSQVGRGRREERKEQQQMWLLYLLPQLLEIPSSGCLRVRKHLYSGWLLTPLSLLDLAGPSCSFCRGLFKLQGTFLDGFR